MATPIDNQAHCATHDVTYPKTSTCPHCPAVDGESLAAIAPVTTDKELSLLESELRADAIYYSKIGRELSAEPRQVNSGLKAAEVSLKFWRAYMEILAERKGREHDAWLVEQNRLLQGNGAP